MARNSFYPRTNNDADSMSHSGHMIRDSPGPSARPDVLVPQPAGVHSWKKFAQKTRVPVGTILGIIFLLLMHPSIRSLWIGGAISLVGACLRIWAAGHIEKGRVLLPGFLYYGPRNNSGGPGLLAAAAFCCIFRNFLLSRNESRGTGTAKRLWRKIC